MKKARKRCLELGQEKLKNLLEASAFEPRIDFISLKNASRSFWKLPVKTGFGK